MAMVVCEKFWEKSRFAKAEREYYEMLNKDIVHLKTDVFQSKIDKKASNRYCTKNFIKSDKIYDENFYCITPRGKLEASDKYRKSRQYVKQISPLGNLPESSINKQSILVSEIAKAREHIKNSLEKMDGISSVESTSVQFNILERFQLIEEENAKLKKIVSSLNDLCLNSQKRISTLEVLIKLQAPVLQNTVEDDDGVDLFASGSDEESEETVRIRQERLSAYAAKKAKKPVLIAKSSLVLDIKPWDDETDLKQMEAEIRKISTDGLLWGASKLVPVAFGIQKLTISCVVEDDKVSIDWLTEEIEKNDDFVQSVDVAAFNKI